MDINDLIHKRPYIVNQNFGSVPRRLVCELDEKELLIISQQEKESVIHVTESVIHVLN